MIIGIPKELKVAEKRVSITPTGVQALVQRGHKVLVEAGAGLGSGLQDKNYIQAGAEVRPSSEVWNDSEMILKVKEPITPEFDLLQCDRH